MRKRNVHVQFWLDKKEAEAFNKKVKRSGLSREAYLRHLVNGLVPQDAPPITILCGSFTGSAATSTRSPRKPMCWASLMSAAMMRKCENSTSSSGTSPKR